MDVNCVDFGGRDRKVLEELLSESIDGINFGTFTRSQLAPDEARIADVHPVSFAASPLMS
jgi:hypothetical protein